MAQNLDVRENMRDKYICPEKGCDLIPEIESVNSDICRIVFKCKNGHIKDVNITEYFNTLKEKKKKEPIEPEEYDNNESDESDERILQSSKDTIKTKNKDISNIIKAHNKILDIQEEHPDNYYHNQNVINLGYSLEKEDDNYAHLNDNFKTIDDIIEKEINNEEEKGKRNQNLKELKEKYYIDLEKYIEKEELFLKLKGPKKEELYLKRLTDDGFKLISKLIFKNLKEINLANNCITNLEPLNDMLLPHLEIINFSDNQITEITPIVNLQSHYLSEIYLQNNEIQDLGPFLNSDFPLLETFRVDGKGNEKAHKQKNFKAICKKYENIIFYEVKSWEKFNKEYEFDCKDDQYQNLFRIDLGSRRKDRILIDLYPLIIFPNNIKSLILDDNKLQDVSLLNRMPLYNLEYLDLSLNFIVSIKFLKKMAKKCKHLKILYLNDNKINDISPLTQIGDDNGIELIFQKEKKENPNIELYILNCLTLKNNNLDLKDKTTKDILEKIINIKEIAMDYEKKDLESPENNSEDSGVTRDSENNN